LERPGLRVEFLGRGKERINLGSAPSNHFIITIRNLQKKPKAIKQFVNCYDSQRFGSAGNNHEIGRLLLKREFAKAAKMVPELSGEKDAVKALLQLPKGVLRIYPHAYQSWLWNKMAGDYFKSHPKTKNLKVPIIGWNTVLRPPFREVGRKLLASEGLRRHDFKIAELPECNLEGDERDLFAIPKNLKIGPLQRDELNSGRRKVTVEFSLGAGSYATMCVRVMMSSKAP
jgi:tRNA(Glu) U13 pseudouridine synthase TruD